MKVHGRVLTTDKILSLHFSPYDIQYLAISDEGGNILIYDYCADYVNDQNKLQIAQNSHPRFLNCRINEMKLQLPKIKWEAHTNAIFDVLWADKGQKLLTCSGDTTIGLWDIEKITRISSFLGHNLSAKCVKEVINNCTYVSGGRDGKICFFDTRQNPGKGCFANIKIAASVLLYNNTVFTGGIVNDVRGRCSIDATSITGLEVFESYYVISSESNEDMLKLYDIRKFQSFIQPYYYNILEESYYPKAKMEQYNAGIFNRKRKKYKPKDTFQLCSFNCISSLILKEERLKEKYALSRFNAPAIQYSKFGLGEELSEDMTALSNTNEESVAAIREAEQIKAIQEKIKAYYSTLVKGNTSLQIDSNGQYLLVCSVDGNLYMYSLKHLDLCPPKIYKSQKASYYSKAEICPSGDLIGSANAEGKVVLWDSQSGDILKVYDDMYAHELNGFSWMHSPQHIFAAGGDEGIVAIYK